MTAQGVTSNPVCPNAANHQTHPTGYIANSDWADDALLVADQQRCPGCGGWRIWVPKRPDVRIAVDWPPGCCDWGYCDADGVAERQTTEGRWLPVCVEHAEVTP